MFTVHRNSSAISSRRLVLIAALGCAVFYSFCFPSLSTAQIIELASPSNIEQQIVKEVEKSKLTAYKATQDPSPSDARHSNSLLKSSTATNSSENISAISVGQISNPTNPTNSTAPEISIPATMPVEFYSNGTQSIGARELGCCAAQRWQPAIGLKQRAQTVQKLYNEQSESKRQAANGIIQFLCLQAYHQEDLAAATVMRAYYTRIGIALQQEALATAVEAIETQRKKQDRLMDQGLASGVDLTSLDRQRIDLRDQSLQASANDDQLRRLISAMTGVDYQTDQVALEPLVVEAIELNCDSLVAVGLRDRYDLQAWRCLCRSINEDSAPLLASLIATSAGSYGIPIPKSAGLKTLLCSDFDKELLARNLRQEVATIIGTNESYAQQLIVEKCSQLQLAYQRWDLQKQRTASWQYRLTQLERLESHGDVRPEDRANAEAGLLKSKSDEIARRMDAKIAEVNLAEVLGGLAGKCCRGEAWLTR